jgi:hypothetical protein
VIRRRTAASESNIVSCLRVLRVIGGRLGTKYEISVTRRKPVTQKVRYAERTVSSTLGSAWYSNLGSEVSYNLGSELSSNLGSEFSSNLGSVCLLI